MLTRGDDRQGDLFRADEEPGTGVWEFAVPAMSLDLGVHSLAQLRRARAGLKNALDKVRNQWGLFVRLADPDHHSDAIISRPLLLHGRTIAPVRLG